MVVVFVVSVKRLNKGCFCRVKVVICNNKVVNWFIVFWFVMKKLRNEKNLCELEVCSGFLFCGCWVVELNFFVEVLDGGCEVCGVVLWFFDCINEIVFGFGLLFYICCLNFECGEINVCWINKIYCIIGNMRGRLIFDVNMKLVVGLFIFNDVKNIVFYIKVFI